MIPEMALKGDVYVPDNKGQGGVLRRKALHKAICQLIDLRIPPLLWFQWH
jgi:hypothetical protein